MRSLPDGQRTSSTALPVAADVDHAVFASSRRCRRRPRAPTRRRDDPHLARTARDAQPRQLLRHRAGAYAGSELLDPGELGGQLGGVRDREVLHRAGERDEQQAHPVRARLPRSPPARRRSRRRTRDPSRAARAPRRSGGRARPRPARRARRPALRARPAARRPAPASRSPRRSRGRRPARPRARQPGRRARPPRRGAGRADRRRGGPTATARFPAPRARAAGWPARAPRPAAGSPS